MARVVVFGTGQVAEVAWSCLTHDSPHDVVAFTVDAAHRTSDEFHGLPVVDFETVEQTHPPGAHAMFVSISYQQVNRLRQRKYEEARAKGYGLVSHVSSSATVAPGVVIGDNCFVHEDTTLQPFTRIGDNVVLWSGTRVNHHTRVGDHVFAASNVVVSGSVRIGARSFLGAGAVLRDNIAVGEATVVGMGAVVTTDTPPGAVVVPARSTTLELHSDDLDRL